MKKLQKRKGFTLVELLIVMAIIAILVLIAAPRFLQSTQTADKRTTEANTRAIVAATQVFYAETNDWPKGIADLTKDSKYLDEKTFGKDGQANTKPKNAKYTVKTDAAKGTCVVEGEIHGQKFTFNAN